MNISFIFLNFNNFFYFKYSSQFMLQFDKLFLFLGKSIFCFVPLQKPIVFQFYLQSIMISQNNSLLIEQSLNQSLILKKSIKVKSSRLPNDFFYNNEMSRYTPRKISLKKSIAQEHTRETYTPSFERFQKLDSGSPVSSLINQRKIGTARVNMNKDDTLINDVINTTKNLKRVFRRKSLELMRKSYQKQQIELHLPKIKNLRR